MRKFCGALVCAAMLSCLAAAQQPTFRDALLDHLAGTWVLQGTIAGKQTTHDITAEWVLAHQYLRLHEVAREKKDNGAPDYEAMVFLGWHDKEKQYVSVWLDDYGAGFDNTIGYGKRTGDEIALLFKYPDGPFHTTFAYDPKTDTWQLRMDSEVNGALKPFARAKLTRK